MSSNIEDDVCKTYIDPIWDKLLDKGLSHIRVLEVGFGRGYNCAELIKRCGGNPAVRLELIGLEPHPEILQPWPPRPDELIAPWWGEMRDRYFDADGGWSLEIRPLAAQHPDAFAGEPIDGFIIDLFSMKLHSTDWEQPFIENMTAAAAKGAILSSYACARSFRDELSAYGWHPQVLRRDGWRDTLVAVFCG